MQTNDESGPGLSQGSRIQLPMYAVWHFRGQEEEIEGYLTLLSAFACSSVPRSDSHVR
jgi:hypothetical protein